MEVSTEHLSRLLQVHRYIVRSFRDADGAVQNKLDVNFIHAAATPVWTA